MIAFRSTVFALSLALSLLVRPAMADEAVRFPELYELIKTNLLGGSESELNRAAVNGLLEQLRGRVSLIDDSGTGTVTDKSPDPVSASILDRAYGYVRLTRIDAGAASDFSATCDRLFATNKLKGLVLDLRFTAGSDYGAAVAIADRFFAGSQPLIDWGQGWKNSSAKSNAISLPVAVLVNSQTSGAAEALAGVLRQGDVALLLGTNTAGQAGMSKEFTLKTGQRLRVAIAPLKVIGGKELPYTGIKPDIHIAVSPDDELAWYRDAYRASQRMARASTEISPEPNPFTTNRTGRRRINEAELVRMSRDGIRPEMDGTNLPIRSPDTVAPIVTDPALVRALDLLKGLSVVQQFRAN